MTLQHFEPDPIPRRSPALSVLPAPEQDAPRFCSLVARILRCRRCLMMLWGQDGRLVVDESVDLQNQRPMSTSAIFPVDEPDREPRKLGPHSFRERPVRNTSPSAFGAYVTDTLISFPLELPDGVTGIVTVIEREDGKPFGPDDLATLEQLAQFYASTYETPARREALRLRSELRALRKESIRAEERERQRLSRELHDDLGHALTTAILGVDMQWQRLPDGDASRDALISAREALTQCADHLHEVAFHLRPVVLQDLGLTPALRSLTRRVSETGAIEAKVIVYGQERRVSDDVELAAFRIAQEALTNALKHAQATCVTTKVTFTEESLELVISDNGVGFPSLATEPYWGRHGQGIAGMRERAELVAGFLEVVSQKDCGTEIWALLPIVESGHD
jgi:signal transduction histidine kinase